VTGSRLCCAVLGLYIQTLENLSSYPASRWSTEQPIPRGLSDETYEERQITEPLRKTRSIRSYRHIIIRTRRLAYAR